MNTCGFKSLKSPTQVNEMKTFTIVILNGKEY